MIKLNLSFKDHIKSYILKNKYNLHDVASYSEGTFRYITDKNINKLWKEFHIDDSNFRMLCDKCNLGREKEVIKVVKKKKVVKKISKIPKNKFMRIV